MFDCAGKTCTEEAYFGLAITVRDAKSGVSICDALVEAIDGAYHDTLSFFPTTCSYFGALERTGTYRIEVHRDGYRAKALDGVEVRMNDPCHVAPTELNIDLEPDPIATHDAGAE